MQKQSVGYLRSILFSMGFLGLLILLTPVVLLLALLRVHVKYRFAVMREWARFCIWWLRLTCNIRYQVLGLENVPDQALILFSKHQSTWETLFLPLLTHRHQAWILKQELMWVPFFGWAMASIGTIPIVRGSGRTAIKRIIELGRHYLDQGAWVVVFPEGTRVAPGEEKRFGVGGAMLAANTQAPILPIAHNAGEFWPRKGFLKYSGTIQVVIGPLLDIRGMKAEEVNTVTGEWMRKAMHDIDPLRYPLTPDGEKE